MEPLYMNIMNYYHNLQGLSHYYPLQETTNNIKKVKSNENLLAKGHPHPAPRHNVKENVKKVEKKVAPNPVSSKQEHPKTEFIEPGTPVDPFESILTTTCITDEGYQTYYTAKQLRGPALRMASQLSLKKQAPRKPKKPIPELPKAVSGSLQPLLEGYGASTYQGLYRKINEDKISIYLQQNAFWFSIYDGHGGNMCAQFLKDNLHQFFFRKEWKRDVAAAMRAAFAEAEVEWKRKGDSSGSCALVVFVTGNKGYTVSLGDSRGLLLSEKFTKFTQVTTDHRPSNPDQQKRILTSGGKIYQTTALSQFDNGTFQQIIGPLRVLPGRMTTTRSFGDSSVKSSQGDKRIIISEPQIATFTVGEHHTMVLASDGMWDYFANEEVMEIARLVDKGQKDMEGKMEKTAEVMIEEAINRGSTDNLSVVVLGLGDVECAQPQQEEGNEHIKILSSIPKVKVSAPKEVEKGAKMQELDEKISEINRNCTRVLGQTRRA